MINYQRTLISLLAILLTGCMVPRVATIWKSDHPAYDRYHKIMVAGIVTGNNDSLRLAIESQMVSELAALGYHAVSAINEYGPYTLRELSEEATYLTLCNNGIDAVLTVALVDEANGIKAKKNLNEKYTNSYYYNHIWNYRKTSNGKINDKQATGRAFIWESILFDLSTLEPRIAIQSKLPGIGTITGVETGTIAGQLVDEMLKEKVIKKLPVSITSPKPF